ncbi:MAG: hypothetical protein AB7U81_05540 [Thiohalomonadaceae bacterium]
MRYEREQIVRLLIELDSGHVDKAEFLARHRITEQQLADWRDQNPLAEAVSRHSPQPTPASDRFLVLALLCLAGLFGVKDFGSSALKDLLTPALLLALTLGILGLVYEDARKGTVRVGRRHTVARGDHPFLFWLVIVFQASLLLAFGGVMLRSML